MWEVYYSVKQKEQMFSICLVLWCWIDSVSVWYLLDCVSVMKYILKWQFCEPLKEGYSREDILSLIQLTVVFSTVDFKKTNFILCTTSVSEWVT